METGQAFDDAFAALFRVAFRVAYRVLGSSSEAEDIAQEALTRALLRWSKIEGHAPAWVATVTLRLAIDAGRRRTRHPTQHLSDEPAEVVDWDRRIDLLAALRRLPKRQRQVLACRYLAGLPDHETAQLLGIAPGSVKQHAARGLVALRGAALSTEDISHA